MKPISKYIAAIVILTITIAGCTKNFDSINTNPDKSSSSSAAWLANGMITSITSNDISNQKTFVKKFLLSKYALWVEGQESEQYNDLGRIDFSRITLLRNITPMLAYAATEGEGEKNSYTALAHFIRAWQFFQLTMQVGDIPYSETVKGESEGLIKPKYDTQKEVFLGILNELDTANTLFAAGADISGDFIYGGNVDKWRRLTNAFELHVLIQLYKKTTDADLKVIERFKEVASRPLMESYEDNFAVTYINSAGYCYPWSNTPVQSNQSIDYPMVSSTLIDQLKTLKDRRLFYYAEPSPAKVDAGASVSDYDAYTGVEPSAVFSITEDARSTGNFSNFNTRYLELFNAEPVGLFNYWDQEFILAEAVVRGWISGSAETYYENGIKGSMNFLAKNTTEKYTHGMQITDDYLSAAYLPSVALTGSMENQVKQIISQKYLAGFFQNVDYTAWFENRRTGYPVFKLNPETNKNTPSTQFPVRWLYPSNELDYNPENVARAIESQYSGNDNVNGIMWILK